MFISIKDLELREVSFDEAFQPGVIDLGPDIRQSGALESSGRANLVEERQGRKKTVEDIRLVGEFSGSLELSCARCLEPVTQELKRTFDLLYRPQGADAGIDEAPVAEAEAEISYYTGDGLLLEDVLREQVLLAVPLKVVCREECRGLCPHCGKNLNYEQCSCAGSVNDVRWAPLKDLKEKLQH
jgi:uncharacterized protein